MKQKTGGVWPTMITPYQNQGRAIDFEAVAQMVEFYVRSGCEGIFAVCQSSEMFFLSPEEKARLAQAVVQAAAGRIRVVASGHTTDDLHQAAEELSAVAEAGVDALVLVSNRLARADEPDSVWVERASRLLEMLPPIPLGLYECPYPWKRVLSDEILAFCLESKRFEFIKDTCCDAQVLQHRIAQYGKAHMKIYNANTATLMQSMLDGAAGYSGVMGNFHPSLYVRLMEHLAHGQLAQAERLQAQLSMFACVECRNYPMNAKVHMNLMGIPMEPSCRNVPQSQWQQANQLEMEQLLLLEKQLQA